MNTDAYIAIIIIEIHRQNENKLMQCSNLVEWDSADNIPCHACVCVYLCMGFDESAVLEHEYECAPLMGCLLQIEMHICWYIAHITKQLSAFKLKRTKCTLLRTWKSLKRSNSKIIFIQIGIKTCSGNYDSYNSKCKCVSWIDYEDLLTLFTAKLHVKCNWRSLILTLNASHVLA